MKKSEKIISGAAIGLVVALFLIPKTRKIIYDAMCTVGGSMKSMLNKADSMVAAN